MKKNKLIISELVNNRLKYLLKICKTKELQKLLSKCEIITLPNTFLGTDGVIISRKGVKTNASK